MTPASRALSRLPTLILAHSGKSKQALLLHLHKNSRRQFATKIETYEKSQQTIQPTSKLSTISFSDVQSTFSTVKTTDLIKSGLMFSSLRLSIVYQNISTILNIVTKIFGTTFVHFAIRHTLFRQFTGGENLDELLETGKKLAQKNVGTIVDYAAESEVVDGGGPTETWLDSNVALTKEGIYSAIALKNSQGFDFSFVAFKVTSVCNPTLCQKITGYLNTMHAMYSSAVGVIPEASISHINPFHHDILVKKDLAKVDAVKLIEKFWPNLSEEAAQDIVNQISQEPGLPLNDADNSISYFQWTNYFSPERTMSISAPVIPGNAQFTDLLKKNYWLTSEDLKAWSKVQVRVNECFKYAADQKVRLLIDAEQTSVQTCLDWVYLKAAEKFCKISEPLTAETADAYLYNTYQMYLKNSEGKLKADAERADRLGYKFAAKLVRGAYILHEQKESEALKIECLVHDNITKTEEAFNAAVDFLFDALPKHEVLCGTHNEKATQRAAQKLGKITGGDPQKYPVTFGQLYGMCDYMSLQLGKLGCRAYKYVPYGALNLVLPYLIRRAEENSSIFGNAKKEANMLWTEVRRRLF